MSTYSFHATKVHETSSVRLHGVYRLSSNIPPRKSDEIFNESISVLFLNPVVSTVIST